MRQPDSRASGIPAGAVDPSLDGRPPSSLGLGGVGRHSRHQAPRHDTDAGATPTWARHNTGATPTLAPTPTLTRHRPSVAARCNEQVHLYHRGRRGGGARSDRPRSAAGAVGRRRGSDRGAVDPDVVEAALRRAWRVRQPGGVGLRYRAARPEGAAAGCAAVADAGRLRSRGALLRRRHRSGVHPGRVAEADRRQPRQGLPRDQDEGRPCAPVGGPRPGCGRCARIWGTISR